MRILVTGATGFIGVEVTRQLAARGDIDVRALVRRVERGPLVSRFGVETVFGSLESAPSIERAMVGVDAVIHLAGRATFEPYDRIAPTIVDGTGVVVRAAAREGVGTVVLGSSAFVYDGSTPIVSDTPVSPALDYGRAKVEAEDLADQLTAGTDTRVAALRLPHVFGPQSLLFGLVRRRFVPFPGRGTNRFAQLHVSDAASALNAAALTGWAGAAPIAADSPTWNTFFGVLQQIAPEVRVLRLPERLATVAAALASPVASRLAPTMVSPDTVRGWNLPLVVEDDRLWGELGIAPRYPTITTSIPATLDGSVAFRWRHPLFDFA